MVVGYGGEFERIIVPPAFADPIRHHTFANDGGTGNLIRGSASYLAYKFGVANHGVQPITGFLQRTSGLFGSVFTAKSTKSILSGIFSMNLSKYLFA